MYHAWRYCDQRICGLVRLAGLVKSFAHSCTFSTDSSCELGNWPRRLYLCPVPQPSRVKVLRDDPPLCSLADVLTPEQLEVIYKMTGCAQQNMEVKCGGRLQYRTITGECNNRWYHLPWGGWLLLPIRDLELWFKKGLMCLTWDWVEFSCLSSKLWFQVPKVLPLYMP